MECVEKRIQFGQTSVTIFNAVTDADYALLTTKKKKKTRWSICISEKVKGEKKKLNF